MTELQKTQQQFLNYLLGKENSFEDDIIGTKRFDSKTRLGIYGNAYAIRLIEALQDNYPALHTLMGDEQFETMAHDYLQHIPSQKFSVRYFGHKLENFLSIDKNTANTPVFAEMAKFEWALRDAFDAQDDVPVTVEALQAVPPEQWGEMRFSLHSSVRRLDLQWNVSKLWKAIENDEDPIPPEKSEYPIAWRVWREKEQKIFYKSLSVDEAWALDAMMNNHNFAEICEGLCEWIDEANTPQRAVEIILSWIDDGLIIAVNV